MVTIPRHKPKGEWTSDDWLRYQRDRAEPESDQYRRARAKALSKAGLEPDDPGETPIDQMTAEQHLQRIRSR